MNELNDSTFEDLKSTDEYLFVFDGAYAYGPKRFAALETSRKSGQAPGIKTQVIIDKEKSSRSATPVLDIIYQEDLPKNLRIFYFSQVSIIKAKKMIAKIVKFNPAAPISILGYSWGGDAAQRLINWTFKKGIKIKSVYTIDPIRRGFMWLGFIKSIKSNSLYFKKRSNVGLFYNVYQKSDHFCLPLIHLRGNFVKDADININLSIENPLTNHIDIETFKGQSVFKIFFEKTSFKNYQ